MVSIKVTAISASSGIVLPEAALARLGVEKGDMLYLTEAPDGALRLTTHDPTFARQMGLAEDIMHDDRDVLRTLAK